MMDFDLFSNFDLLLEAAQMMLDASVADETDVSSVNQTSDSTLTATDIDLTHAYADQRKPFKNITNSDVSTLSANSERSSGKQPSQRLNVTQEPQLKRERSGVSVTSLNSSCRSNGRDPPSLNDAQDSQLKRTSFAVNSSLDTSARGATEALRQRLNLTQEPQLKRERSGVLVTSLNSSGRSNGRGLLSLNATQNTQLKRTRAGVLVTSFNSGRSIEHGSPSASLIGSPEKYAEAEDIAAIRPIRRKLSAHQLEFTTNTHKEAKETSNNLPAPKRLPTTSSPNRREFPDEDPFGDITVISRNNCLFDDAGFEDAEDEDEGSEEHPEEAEYDAEVDVESDGEESTPYVIHVSLVEQYFMPYANLSLFDDHDPLETIDPLQTSASTSESVIVPKRKLNDNLGGHVDAANAHSAAPTTALNVPAGDFRDLNIDAIQKKQKKKTTSNRDLRAKGLPYLRRNGTMAPARRLKTPCECKKLKCHETFSDEMRALFFKTFLKLTSSAQNQFLSNHVLIKLVAYHNVVNSRRTYTYTYHLPACGGMLRVCKKMFLSTFDVKSKKMRCLMNKKRSESGIVEDDKRALNHNRYTIPTDEVKFINGHILSFPSCTSHYGREKSSKLFLSSDMSIAAMYRLYVAECTKRETRPVHYNSYKAIFKTYNLAFRTLKVDTCGTCDYLAVSIKGCQQEREKLELVSKQTDHHQLSKFVFDQKTMDINPSNHPALKTGHCSALNALSKLQVKAKQFLLQH
ncbi:uncharacterized protein LOC120418177 [Culex pipiens pallens]|uniref:uncharacterized protein LOC120418177 n=1 Tax=Culex pipiens pallens TaxID=42434 RepID=UPI0019548DC6|nr:uncharacterized protein LOC120418177 [Culex pipiens pallens]